MAPRILRGASVAAGVLRLLGVDTPATAQPWRAAWEEVGVVCDPVSSRVLVLNLVLHGDAAACRLIGAAGPEPLWLTWRSLSGPFGCDAPDVHVCENPSVLIAAADQLGADALPLVCTNGRPSAGVRHLHTRLPTVIRSPTPTGPEVRNPAQLIDLARQPGVGGYRHKRSDGIAVRRAATMSQSAGSSSARAWMVAPPSATAAACRAGVATGASGPVVTAPTRATPAGRAYLDLRKKARQDRLGARRSCTRSGSSCSSYGRPPGR
jgi:hypothetical protein